MPDNGEHFEYAVRMSDGGYHIRSSSPEVERIYPLRQWVIDNRLNGDRVYRRRIVVIQDWHEVGGFDDQAGVDSQ